MRVTINNKVENLPDFLIVGAAKSGTTSLYHYLQQHPSIFLFKNFKESLFFQIISNPNKSQIRFQTNVITEFKEYLKEFSKAKDNQICGEVCPSYLYYYDKTIKNIKRYHKDWKKLKIIIILRNPVDRIISHYKFAKNRLHIETLSLYDALKNESVRKNDNTLLPDLHYVSISDYYNQVKAYLDEFENVKILLYDELLENPLGLMNELTKYLNISSDFDFELTKHFNSSRKGIKSKNIFGKILLKRLNFHNKKRIIKLIPNYKLRNICKNFFFDFTDEKIDQDTIEYLQQYFHNKIDKLELLIKKDLSNWKYNIIN